MRAGLTSWFSRLILVVVSVVFSTCTHETTGCETGPLTWTVVETPEMMIRVTNDTLADLVQIRFDNWSSPTLHQETFHQ